MSQPRWGEKLISFTSCIVSTVFSVPLLLTVVWNVYVS